MKSILFAIIFAICPLLMYSGNLVESANQAYSKDKYAEALDLYLKAAKQDGTSSELFYNIGNTYYRMGEMGRAILYYEKAILLNPSNEEARVNLDFVRNKAKLSEDTGASFVEDWVDSVVSNLSSNAWSVVSAVLFISFLGLLLLYVFATGIFLRKLGFFGGGVVLLMFLVSIFSAFHMKSKEVGKNKAIVVIPSATLSTSPRTPKDKSEEAFLLVGGSKVTIVDSVSNKGANGTEVWYDVKTAESNRAWIKKTDVEII